MELDPHRSAVLGLHWIRDIVTAEGAFGPMFAKMVETAGVIGSTQRLFAAARQAGVPIIYTRVCYRPGYPDLIANGPLLQGVRDAGALVDGEPGAEIIPELAAQPGDVVVDHRRITGFSGTDLDTILKAREIDTVLLTGVATNITVEGTARDAVNLGYRTIVISDCTSAANEAAHEASLGTLGILAECASSSDVIAALKA
jgi:nicotinamidase-related amidase